MTNQRVVVPMKRIVLALAVVAVLSGACGGTAPVATDRTPGNAAGTGTAPVGSVTPPGGKKTSPPSTASPRPSGKTTPRPGQTSTFAPSHATLDKACVQRGVDSDVQGVTVQTGPNGPASYQTVYSDGSTVIDRPQQYASGGQGGGFADDSGRFRSTWVVPDAAPTGRATVQVVVAGAYEPIKLPFTIVAAGDACP